MIFFDHVVVDCFANNCVTFADKVAIKDEFGEYAYNEIQAAVKHFTAVLAPHINNGDTIAVCMQRSHKLVIAILSLWYLGAIYLPIDDRMPIKRKRLLLQKANATAIIADEYYYTDTQALEVKLMPVYQFESLQQQTMITAVLVNSSSTMYSAAYKILTSGSSGEPKVITINHAIISNLAQWQADQAQSTNENYSTIWHDWF